eukprot:354195-Chlamydomonas_euryale.AAC.4
MPLRGWEGREPNGSQNAPAFQPTWQRCYRSTWIPWRAEASPTHGAAPRHIMLLVAYDILLQARSVVMQACKILLQARMILQQDVTSLQRQPESRNVPQQACNILLQACNIPATLRWIMFPCREF